MTTQELMMVGVGITNALAVGMAWANMKASVGRLRADVAAIKKVLGNGEPGVFVRKSELALMREEARRDHERYEQRLDALEKS